MIPIGDDNPTLRTPWMTLLILAGTLGVWVLGQGGGLDELRLAESVCNLGMVPAELLRTQPVGFAVPMGPDLACVVDDEPINWLTPITSMFLHGSWTHLLGNALFLWVFGNNVEDSMGPLRFLLFYLLCGALAAAAHVAAAPTSPIPTVGASGAISGVLGAYLVLYPRARVKLLFYFLLFVRVIKVPAWIALLWWLAFQVISGLPQLSRSEMSGGVAFWAHIGGFVAGVALVKLFEDPALVGERRRIRAQRYAPDVPG